MKKLYLKRFPILFLFRFYFTKNTPIDVLIIVASVLRIRFTLKKINKKKLTKKITKKMEQIKSYFYLLLNLLIAVILLYKWFRYKRYKSSNEYFVNVFYYNKYRIVNSRNMISEKNKKIQNNSSLILLCIVCIEIILLVL